MVQGYYLSAVIFRMFGFFGTISEIQNLIFIPLEDTFSFNFSMTFIEENRCVGEYSFSILKRSKRCNTHH